MSKSGKIDVRESIGWLCKCLSFHKFSRLAPEVFRQAKFDSDAAVKPLWQLILETVTYLKRGTLVSDDAVQNTSQDLNSILYTKHAVLQLGYKSVHFLALPVDQSSGSRELLLAFGWLLATYSILDLLCEKIISASTAFCEDSLFAHQDGDRNDNNNARSSHDLKDQLEWLMWSFGQLKFAFRSLLSEQDKRLSMLHQIHRKTWGTKLSADKNHLSMLQAFVLNHPSMLKQYLETLDDDTKMISCYLKWKEGEPIFWQWMNTVLELKLQCEQPVKFDEDAAGIDEMAKLQHFRIDGMRTEDCSDIRSFRGLRKTGICLYGPRIVYNHHQRLDVPKDWKLASDVCQDLTQQLESLKEKLKSRRLRLRAELPPLVEKLPGVTLLLP